MVDHVATSIPSPWVSGGDRVAEGLSNAGIARRIQISPEAAETQVEGTSAELEVADRTQAVVWGPTGRAS